MGLYGADVAELRNTADAAASSAAQIQAISQRLSLDVDGTTAWQGWDAVRFRADWSNVGAPTLLRSVQFLESAAEALARHAAEQDGASAAGGAEARGATKESEFGYSARDSGIGGAAGVVPAGNPTPREPGDLDPEEAATWWHSLTEAERRYFIQNSPDAIGNLDGLPGAVRDEVNRLRLDAEESRLESELATASGDRMEQIQESLRALGSVRDALKVEGKQTQLLLLDIDNGAQPKAAIAVGNVDTADHVGVFTPGISTTVGSDMSRYVRDMANLNDMAQSVDSTAELGDRSKALLLAEGKDGSVANVAWLGYDFPTGVSWDVPKMASEIATSDAAVAGGKDLGDFGEGLNAGRSDSFHLTAMGHSYGSVTTGHAVQGSGAFDSVVFFGSPGIGTNSISNIQVPNDQVFVMEADRDFVADIGWFGGDPNHLNGVTNLSTDASNRGDHISGHSSYLAQKSTSQHNLAAVVTGNSNLAVRGSNSGLGDFLGGGIGGNQRLVDGFLEDGFGGALRGIGNAAGSMIGGVVDSGYRLGEVWDDLWGKK